MWRDLLADERAHAQLTLAPRFYQVLVRCSRKLVALRVTRTPCAEWHAFGYNHVVSRDGDSGGQSQEGTPECNHCWISMCVEEERVGSV